MSKLKIMYETLADEEPKDLIQLNIETKKEGNDVFADVNIKIGLNGDLYLDHNGCSYLIPKDTTTLHLHFLADDDSIECLGMYHINPEIISVQAFFEHENQVLQEDQESAIALRDFLEESEWSIEPFEYVIWFQDDNGGCLFLSFENYDTVVNTNLGKVFYIKNDILTENSFETSPKALFQFPIHLN